jgi:Protein of unknown function (DUF2845)
MNCKTSLIAVAVFLLPLMPQPVLADSMRCGTHIISSGERQGTNKYEVLKKCGEPTIRSGNTWIYQNAGGGRRVVIFDADDNVASIK